MELNKNEIKKELLKSKVMAHFSHYSNGKIYYNVQMTEGLFQFPIESVEPLELKITVQCGDDEEDKNVMVIKSSKKGPIYSLSSDLGTTKFDKEIRASELNRWIGKAIDKEEFIFLKK